MNKEKNGDNSNIETGSKNVQEIKYISTGDGTSEVLKLQPENVGRKPDTFYLYFVVLTGAIPLLVGGSAAAWMSPVLPSLQSNDTSINPLENPITVVDTSMLAALPTLLGVAGCLGTPKLADFTGRKNFLLIMGVVMLVSYLGQALAHRVIYLLIHRCALLVVLNGAMSILPVYIAEVSEDHNRAKYMSFNSLYLSLGNVYAYILGPHLSFRDFNIVCALPILPFLILFCLTSDTPVYYLSKGNTEDCKKAIKKLRSNKNIKELDMDFNKIDETLKVTKSITKVTFLSLFKTKEARFAVKLTIFLSAFQYCCGVSVIAAFLGPLLHAAGTSYSEYTMTVVVGMVQVLSILMTPLFIEKTGRRVLLILSSIGCCLCLFLFGLFYYLKANNSPILPQIQWLPLVCIIAYFITFAIGLAQIPMTVITEIFPPDLAATATSLALIVMSTTAFLLTFIYPILLDYCGVQWCLWLYSMFCLVGGVLVYKIMPETKGKSSIEIQEMLKLY